MVKFTIKQARMYADLSETEMADLLGVCRETYRKIEQNPNYCKKNQWEIIEKTTKIPKQYYIRSDNVEKSKANHSR